MKYLFTVTRTITGSDNVAIAIGDNVAITEERTKTEMQNTVHSYTGKVVSWEVVAFNEREERMTTITIETQDKGSVTIRGNNITHMVKQ
jgi:hypothetical protein